ncbi:MAG: gamma-glutamyl-gamma-aminobutyrate hydrolase family protein [Lachnospiraceae bacterium]|nr:gamma-glutamyl-gamma-aminobutyrate hydrolase family protein [Lachnospiraceae bacterium]
MLKRILIAGESGKTANYENAMKELGAEAVTALHVPDNSGYDGLILPGGGDIDPKLFGQLPKGTRAFDPELDRIQLAILKTFILDRKPVLGICKGMQLINIYFGGDMIQHLPDSDTHEYKGADQVHETVSVSGSFLDYLYGNSFNVNSAHHQAVDMPGQGICYVQYAGAVPEALCHRYLPVIGVQWHPERMCFAHKREDTADGSLLLEYFLKLF